MIHLEKSHEQLSQQAEGEVTSGNKSCYKQLDGDFFRCATLSWYEAQKESLFLRVIFPTCKDDRAWELSFTGFC